MMDPSETNNFENQWKKAFEQASETPPPSVWEGIEARLDRDENNIIPLWWRNTKLWYAAASMAALLLVAGGIWYNKQSEVLNNGNVAVKTPQAKAQEAVTSENDPESAAVPGDLEEGLADKTGLSDLPEREKNALAKGKDKNQKTITNSFTRKKPSQATFSEEQLAANMASKRNTAGAQKAEKQVITDPTSMEIAERENLPFTDSGADKGAIAAIQAEPLKPVPFSEQEIFMQKRYVFFKPGQAEEEKLPEMKKRKEYWAGIGLMPASFNPDVKIKAAPTAFASQFASRQKSVTGTSEAGSSYSLQTQGGVRLTKHWSVEMGLSYLRGNSKYEGGGYVLNAYNMKSTNVLESALNGFVENRYFGQATPDSPSAGVGQSFNTDNVNTLFIDVNKKVNNNYQFLQLPVQAGFTLNPDKKLSYSVLGGMMANFFLNNKLESASGNIITTRPGDEVYKSMNWAATTGLRFNYSLSSKWKASLTGSYQQSLSSGFKENQSLESRPYLYGVSWGMRYSF
jgi:hypothetical protein